nr:NAD(P)/FAD-dependent oxidoreductase [Sporolactobacillus spathodeae]
MDLNNQVKKDLSYLSLNGPEWVLPASDSGRPVYDAIIVGGGQCGLGIAFGLIRERIRNILVIDENKQGFEGPWVAYARMRTLRTPKDLTPIDFGIPSLTFRAWWEAQYGAESWHALDKIPRTDWMNYLKWYRKILNLPVHNEICLRLIEPEQNGIYTLHIEGKGAPAETLRARKVILATGVQGGGAWYVPDFIKEGLPKNLYAHTSEAIDFSKLKGKCLAILGGGASAFDNAAAALAQNVNEVHVFVRRKALGRINPIRQMEPSGLINHFHTLNDAEKYAVMARFFSLNQPPTTDMFNRAAAYPGFYLHLGAPWLNVCEKDGRAAIQTPHGRFTFDYLIISTGLRTDPALRPELRLIADHIVRWGDRYSAPEAIKSPMLDAHPYLSEGFAFQGKEEATNKMLRGIFSFTYAAMVSCGLSASALSAMKYSLPRVVRAITDQLFEDDKNSYLNSYFTYDVPEFQGQTSEGQIL